jgi:hypothetical protein
MRTLSIGVLTDDEQAAIVLYLELRRIARKLDEIEAAKLAPSVFPMPPKEDKAPKIPVVRPMEISDTGDPITPWPTHPGWLVPDPRCKRCGNPFGHQGEACPGLGGWPPRVVD